MSALKIKNRLAASITTLKRACFVFLFASNINVDQLRGASKSFAENVFASAENTRLFFWLYLCDSHLKCTRFLTTHRACLDLHTGIVSCASFAVARVEQPLGGDV